MNEHHWPDDHDAGPEHHDDAVTHDEVAPDLDLNLPEDDVWDAPSHDEPPPGDDHDPGYQHHVEEPIPAAEHHSEVVVDADPHELATVGADPDALPDTDDQVGVFPPVVDVGPLPEPVDGYPWIDTGSLGLIDPATVPTAAGSPDPGELADYAAEDLPPGADPWAALAGSPDPAIAALAKFWNSTAAGTDQP
jgi:hypothetical protein